MSNETTSLIPQSSKNIGWGEWVTHHFGSLATFLAMVPPGLLGALLTDKYFQEYLHMNNIYWRILPDAMMFFTAEEGKRRLVRFFNKEAFKSLGRAQTWKDFFDCSKWQFSDYFTFPLNTILSLFPSGMFTYLTTVGLKDISPLLKTYNTPTTDLLAGAALHPVTQGIFAGASFMGNMLNFPGIHKGGVAFLENTLRYIVENPEFRHKKEELELAMKASLLEIKTLYSQDNFNEAKEKLAELSKRNTQELSVYLIQHVPEKYKKAPETWIEFIAKITAFLSLLPILVWGFFNFYSLGPEAASFFLGLFPSLVVAPLFKSILGSMLGIGSYASMLVLGIISVKDLVSSLYQQLFGRDVELNVFSPLRSLWILGLTFVVCLLGGAPNAYQSLITGGKLPEIIMAFLAPMLTELMGFYSLTKEKHEKEIFSNDGVLEQFYKDYKAVCDKVGGLEALTEQEFKKLYYQYENQSNQLVLNNSENNDEKGIIVLEEKNVTSKYRPFVNSIRQCLWGDSKSSIGKENVVINQKFNSPKKSCCSVM